MILGIGIDVIEIERFQPWTTYSSTKLKRIFSEAEIAYCRIQPNKTAERLAARFATREAFFKALSAAAPEAKIPFLTLCSKIQVLSTAGAPQLIVDWSSLETVSGTELPKLRVLLTLTHTATTATALVLLEAISPATRTLI